MSLLEPIVLTGHGVRLEPLGLAHLGPLLEAASASRDTFGLTRVPADEAQMRAYLEEALALREQGLALPFATFALASGRVVGATRFGHLERWSWPGERAAPVPRVDFEAAEIGWTWLAASAQRTGVNTGAKLLMLGHAFEVWGLRRVNLKTDVRNLRSRAAIERLGARLEGILRAQLPAADGGVRDTALYSLLAAEWPEAKAALMRRGTS